MLLNIFAEPITKVLARRTYRKAIHYLENELKHTALPDDEPVRPSHTVPYSIWDTEWEEESDYATGFDQEEFRGIEGSDHE